VLSDRKNPDNAPPQDSDVRPAAIELPDEIVRKQQALRRYLQDAASPAFNDPVHAAELAGFRQVTRSGVPNAPGGRPILFRNIPSIGQAVLDAASRKTAVIEKLRRCVSEGLEATKVVTVHDPDGARRSVEIPDQSARRKWAETCLRLENLLPHNGNNDGSDTLPHEAAMAEEFERSQLRPDIAQKVRSMTVADKWALSETMIKLEHLREQHRRHLIAVRLGKPIEEFEKEIEQEAAAEFASALRNAGTKSDAPQKGPTNE
jgi:hypothetical protein